jgi:L-ribulose-5-phosphate 4-epimerase
MSISHLSLRQAVIDGANFLVRVGAISMSHHGNFSVRVPNTDTILLTATSSFDNLKPENLALLDLDGKLLEGEISPTNAEIVHMHAVVYKHRPETGAVVHTHSTYATSFALASRSLGCSYEALVRSDMTDGVPLAQ